MKGQKGVTCLCCLQLSQNLFLKLCLPGTTNWGTHEAPPWMLDLRAPTAGTLA